MFVRLLKGKLHGATVTEAKLHYAGSIAIDLALMDAVGMLPYEVVLIADMNSGHRLETYAVPTPAKSDQIIVLDDNNKIIKSE